jgi:hypothetical protein
VVFHGLCGGRPPGHGVDPGHLGGRGAHRQPPPLRGQCRWCYLGPWRLMSSLMVSPFKVIAALVVHVGYGAYAPLVLRGSC